MFICKTAINLSGKVILVDMDGVMCDFNQRLLNLAVEKLGAPKLSQDRLTNFRTKDCFPEEWRAAVSMLPDEAGFYEGLDPMPHVARALSEMKMLGADVFICTTPKKFYKNPHCAGEKHGWVMKHLGHEWTEKIILTRDKTLVQGHVLIDDKPKVTGVLTTPPWKHVYFDQPYNREDMKKSRITSWSKWKEVVIPLLG